MEIVCFECGYEGLGGIVSTEPTFPLMKILISLAIIYSVALGIGFIFDSESMRMMGFLGFSGLGGLIFWIFLLGLVPGTNTTAECPKCKEQLWYKGGFFDRS